jgi:hypothetical protein
MAFSSGALRLVTSVQVGPKGRLGEAKSYMEVVRQDLVSQNVMKLYELKHDHY